VYYKEKHRSFVSQEVNSDKTKYMDVSQNRNAEQSHYIETDNSSSERAEEFKIFGNNRNKSKF
jgi:hypothetical protein